LLGGNVQAGPTTLILQPAPDIFSGYIDVTYDANSNLFSSTGYNLTIYNGTDPETDPQIDFNEYNWGDFSISAAIDDAGVASSGSLNLSGKVLGYGTTGSLLTGDLTFFNAFFADTLNPNSDVAIFEFLFDVTGGEMADMFGGLGTSVGVIIGCVSVGGNVAQEQFTADFDNLFDHGPGYGSAVADTAPIPEPVTILLLALGAMIIRKK
jgi:hypothetical protein